MTMKVKVTILTAAVIALILIVLDSFIFMTLKERMSDLERNVITAKAQTIERTLLYQHGIPQWPLDPPVIYPHLRARIQDNQGIIILDAGGNILASVGTTLDTATLNALNPAQLAFGEVVQYNHSWYMVKAVPIAAGPTVYGYVLYIEDIQTIEDNLHTLLTVLILGSLGAIILAGAGGYAISSAAVRPIDRMIDLANRIQANHLDERLPIKKGGDEVARLGHTFNSMLDRIERSFAQQARFVADASHEIRTPMTTIQGYADLLLRWGKTDPEILAKAISVIRSESTRLQNLTNDLLTLADIDASYEPLQNTCDAAQIAREIVESLAPLHPQNLQLALLQTSFVRMPGEYLTRVIRNLIDNAIKYTPQDGQITVSVMQSAPYCKITVEDTGCGVPEEDLPHIFERFYRVDKARSRQAGGSGLGLAIVKELVALYQGNIKAQSQLGCGTTIQLTLPLANASSE